MIEVRQCNRTSVPFSGPLARRAKLHRSQVIECVQSAIGIYGYDFGNTIMIKISHCRCDGGSPGCVRWLSIHRGCDLALLLAGFAVNDVAVTLT